MRITIDQDKLTNALGIVSRAVTTRSTLPVLGNILIQTDGSALKLAATNLEIGITTWAEATVDAPGSVTLPAKLFSDLVTQSPPERIALTLNEKAQEVRYRCGPVDARVKGIDSSEFPIIPSAEDGTTVRVPAMLLKEMIEQVAFAAATDESRPILTGVRLTLGETVDLAAADGFRLALRSAPLAHATTPPRSVIVPARALIELARLCGDAEEVVLRITRSRNQMVAAVGAHALSAQLIEGNFPDVQRLVPANYSTRTVIDTAGLLRAVRRAYLFARDAANIIRFQIDPAGRLTVSAEANELGENEEELIAHVEGDGHEIAFNAKYLMDMLGVVPTAQVALETTRSGSPGLWRPVTDEAAFAHVIMPMHIGS